LAEISRNKMILSRVQKPQVGTLGVWWLTYSLSKRVREHIWSLITQLCWKRPFFQK